MGPRYLNSSRFRTCDWKGKGARQRGRDRPVGRDPVPGQAT